MIGYLESSHHPHRATVLLIGLLGGIFLGAIATIFVTGCLPSLTEKADRWRSDRVVCAGAMVEERSVTFFLKNQTRRDFWLSEKTNLILMRETESGLIRADVGALELPYFLPVGSISGLTVRGTGSYLLFDLYHRYSIHLKVGR